MPAGFGPFPALTPATRGLLASRWKVGSPLRSLDSDARIGKTSYSSIADAMLGRAAKSYENTAPKADLVKQLFPSTSPAQNGNIEEQFRKVRQSSQSTRSIGGYTGVVNTSRPLNATSPNVLKGLGKSTSVVSAMSNSGLASILSNPGCFKESPKTTNLSRESPPHPISLIGSHDTVLYDENDFDDDLDLDMEYEIPSTMGMAAPPKPSLNMVPQSSYELPQLKPTLSKTHAPHVAASSAHTWSSSSPSHRRTPPRAGMKRCAEDTTSCVSGSQTLNEAEAMPRPAKRRTLPWLQKQAEEDEIAARVEEQADNLAAQASSGSSPPPALPRGRIAELTAKYTFPQNHEGKGKNMPWNTTAKEQEKLLKGKLKRPKTKNDTAARVTVEAKKATMAPITLSHEQKRVQDLVVNQQKSVFFTGSAGTGKSVLMRSIIADLRKKYVREPDRIAVTASTGLAACNIGGVTLHSFGGIGLGKEDVPTLVKKIKRNQKARNRWIRTKILVIDEISMVDGDLFDKLEAIARAMRNNGRPFGGIQLVITGDFFQLPPVPDYGGRNAKFAFDAGTWSTAIHHTIGLTEVFRQKDPVFANMLNEMRLGKITDETVQAFRKLSRKITYEDSLDATELFPTRNEVENSNAFRMRDLHGKSYKYEAKDTGAIQDVAIRDKLLSNMMAPKVIELKKGAQVMLIKNLDDGLVNGSLGKVVAFMNDSTFDIWHQNPDDFNEHKPLDLVRFQESSSSSDKRSKMPVNDEKGDAGRLYPLVCFSVADGTQRYILCQPEEWKVELPSGEVQAQRSQLPLILAWALSIHKAQGQTLERVKIDLKKIFEKGQAYVALSRATSQAGLEVQNFDKNKVMAHPRVAEFYNSLYSVNQALQHPKVARQNLPVPPPKTTTMAPKQQNNVRRVQRDDFDDEEEAMAAAYG